MIGASTRTCVSDGATAPNKALFLGVQLCWSDGAMWFNEWGQPKRAISYFSLALEGTLLGSTAVKAQCCSESQLL